MPEQRKEPLNAPAPRRSARLNADESRMATGLPGMQKVELSGNISVEGHSRQKGRSDPRRARNDEGPRNNLYGDPSINAMKHLSSAERDSWKGWCEIESEPAFFNVMLSEFGLTDIKVQEVFSLDEEMAGLLNQPVHGLVFLSQFQEDESGKQEASCPDTIWFANQTTSNACATIALLNIVMNIPDIELGEILKSLKDFTTSMSPPLRGYTIGNHDYIRRIHNSFARKMDILDADLSMSNAVTARKKPSKRATNDEEPGFHFIAYVPIMGSVWKLDGLEKQPTNLGISDGDWMDVVRPLIEERMQQYEGEQIQFNLLSICRSPLATVPQQLADSFKTLRTIETQLDSIQEEWKHSIDDGELSGDDSHRDDNFGISETMVQTAQPSATIVSLLASPQEMSVEYLLILRHEVLCLQASLRKTYLAELANIQQDHQRAACRRHDYTPLIHTWLKMLASKGVLGELAARVDTRA